MAAHVTDTTNISELPDAALSDFLKKNALALTVFEARKIVGHLGRNPTMTELHIFNTQWSEHASYKSSRSVLKMLPTAASNVILGPSEDSGIVELGVIDGERWGVVISHESHNHPSQVVPYEGAATGVGGNIRDVACMGARVIASADPLRFGNPVGKNKNKVKYIANEVVNGIAGYGNAVGIPTIAGDVYFNDTFDDNCLVNVVTIGIVREQDIIHSRAPKNAEGYDIIIVGKATDNSGFGGAAFSSLVLDENERDSNRGAVQVPDPFLKSVLLRASYKVFEEARKQGVVLGFKDMGAGGIMCCTSEMCAAGGYGAEINLDTVHVALQNLPPFIIACSETQERFGWISPSEFTPTILKIYNQDFELSRASDGAQASVVGKVTKKPEYVLRHKGKIVCAVLVEVLTKGIRYERERKKNIRNYQEPNISEPQNYQNYNEICLQILKHPAVASKALAYNHYDKEVLCKTIIRPGEADAGVVVPLKESAYAVALSVDHNPRYSRIDPYWGAVNAVWECMRNVAAVGAVPSALTDCLNFGNPEKPEVFDDFYESVRGITDAAKKLCRKDTNEPVPVISGNVSFYNESKKGSAVDPSPIISCIGIMNDYRMAVSMKIKERGNLLILVGKRKDELGGSVYYDVHNELGSRVPALDFETEKNMLYAVIDAINAGLVSACHDISDGGLLACVSEMILGGNADGEIGAEILLDFSDLSAEKILFSETGGFVMEVRPKDFKRIQKIFLEYQISEQLITLGTTGGDRFTAKKKNQTIIALPIPQLQDAWTGGFVEAMK